MRGIFYKEGIYVLIRFDVEDPNDNNYENDICVYHTGDFVGAYLFGGRIEIGWDSRETAFLTVDGISIVYFRLNSIIKGLSLSEISSHLNAIEANGVDTFIQNYKKSIEFTYGELKELNQKTESLMSSGLDDSNIKVVLSDLEDIRRLLVSVLGILFSLYTHLTAGLENEKVVSVCQSIMDSL